MTSGSPERHRENRPPGPDVRPPSGPSRPIPTWRDMVYGSRRWTAGSSCGGASGPGRRRTWRAFWPAKPPRGRSKTLCRYDPDRHRIRAALIISARRTAMRRRSTAWGLASLLVMAAPALAQGSGSTESKGSTKTVKKEDVKTWTTTVDGKEWSVRPAAPTYGGDTGLFRLSSAYTLTKGKVSFGLFRENYDRDPKGVDFSVHGFNLAYGATDKLEIFGSVGIQDRVRTNYAFEPGYPNDYPFVGSDHWQTGFGDVKLGLKYALLSDYRGDPLGLAIKGVVKLPTADEKKGLGTGETSFSGDLILSKTINYGADLHASIGYEVNNDPDGADLANALRWGVGLNVPACRLFQLQAQADEHDRPHRGARHLDQARPVHPPRLVVWAELRQSGAQRLVRQEVREAPRDRLPPRHALLRDLHRPRAAPAASGQPAPHGLPHLRETHVAPGGDDALQRLRLRSRRRPAHLRLVDERGQDHGQRREHDPRQRRRPLRHDDHGHRDRVRRPRWHRLGQRHRQGALPGEAQARAGHLHLRGLPAQPRPLEQRRQGLPGRRGQQAASGPAEPGGDRGPRRQQRALPRGDRPEARGGGQELPGQGARDRRGPHHGQERRRHQAARYRQDRRRPRQEPSGGRGLRPRGGDVTGGRRLDVVIEPGGAASHPQVPTLTAREPAPEWGESRFVRPAGVSSPRGAASHPLARSSLRVCIAQAKCPRIRTYGGGMMRFGRGILLPVVVAGSVLGLPACNKSSTTPTPVATPTPPAVRGVLGSLSFDRFETGYVAVPLPLSQGGILDVTVDWTFPDSWIFVYIARGTCTTYAQLTGKTCSYIVSSETQFPKPRVVVTPPIPAGTYTLVIYNVQHPGESEARDR